MTVRISALGDVPACKGDVEIVERKALGHPAEAIARDELGRLAGRFWKEWLDQAD